MTGTINCIYETPCGWCSKWDKKCDKKTPERGQRAKCNPVDDTIDDDGKEYLNETLTNKMCTEESDHEWVCIGISTAGTAYMCKKCNASKICPTNYDSLKITI